MTNRLCSGGLLGGNVSRLVDCFIRIREKQDNTADDKKNDQREDCRTIRIGKLGNLPNTIGPIHDVPRSEIA